MLVALVAVDPGTRPGRLARQLPGPVVPIPHEPGLAAHQGGPAGRPGAGPRRPYRTACLRLAADLLRTAQEAP